MIHIVFRRKSRILTLALTPCVMQPRALLCLHCLPTSSCSATGLLPTFRTHHCSFSLLLLTYHLVPSVLLSFLKAAESSVTLMPQGSVIPEHHTLPVRHLPASANHKTLGCFIWWGVRGRKYARKSPLNLKGSPRASFPKRRERSAYRPPVRSFWCCIAWKINVSGFASFVSCFLPSKSGIAYRNQSNRKRAERNEDRIIKAQWLGALREGTQGARLQGLACCLAKELGCLCS